LVSCPLFPSDIIPGSNGFRIRREEAAAATATKPFDKYTFKYPGWLKYSPIKFSYLSFEKGKESEEGTVKRRDTAKEESSGSESQGSKADLPLAKPFTHVFPDYASAFNYTSITPSRSTCSTTRSQS
jgi:hypothetical protein